MDIRYLVVHTAAFDGRNCDADRIRGWHLDRGWRDIGYHYVILNDRHDTKADGTLEEGRPPTQQGAHCKGINSQSLGICMVGHGDREPFTAAQRARLLSLLSELAETYEVPRERIIGHREVNALVDAGQLSSQYRTSKSCPGHLIDMDAIRSEVNSTAPPQLTQEHAELRQAFATIEQHLEAMPNAKDEYQELRHHPEVLQLLGRER